MPRQARADALERAAALLSRARCPLVLVGEELSDGAATDELVALARLLRAPVACTEGACGAMPADDPAMLGPAVAGRHWGENPLLGFARRCDATVVLGSSLPYRSTLSIGLELPRPLVHVSLDERALGRTYDADVCIHADARLVLPRLRQLLETRPLAAATATANAAEIESVRRAIHDRLATSWPGSVRAFAAIREVLPRDATTVWDPAAITFRALRCFPAYLPRTLLWTHGWQGLGFSLPAAIGARLAQPHREAICFAGDGGFQYNLQELATLRQLGASVAMVVVNDDAWGALKAYQRKNYGGRYFGVDLTNPDFVALAEAYGIEGVRVRTVAELCRALDHHIGSERPHLIEVDAPHGIEGLAPG